jgi:hypothetical protein
MPYDICRLYQIERAKRPAEVRRADERAAGWPPLRHRCSVASRGPGEPSGGHPRPRRVTCPARLTSRPPADLPAPGGRPRRTAVVLAVRGGNGRSEMRLATAIS